MLDNCNSGSGDGNPINLKLTQLVTLKSLTAQVENIPGKLSLISEVWPFCDFRFVFNEGQVKIFKSGIPEFRHKVNLTPVLSVRQLSTLDCAFHYIVYGDEIVGEIDLQKSRQNIQLYKT